VTPAVAEQRTGGGSAPMHQASRSQGLEHRHLTAWALSRFIHAATRTQRWEKIERLVGTCEVEVLEGTPCEDEEELSALTNAS
jgi:hypothetical protein